HQLLRHVELLWPHVGTLGEVKLAGLHQLVREPHYLQHQRVATRLDAHEMLCVAHHDLPDAHYVRVADCSTQQRVWLFATLGGRQIVWSLEVPRIDLTLLHEIQNLDRCRFAKRRCLEILVGEHDVLSLLEFESLHDVVPREWTLSLCGKALVLYRREILPVQKTEADVVFPHCRAQLDRNVHETKAE